MKFPSYCIVHYIVHCEIVKKKIIKDHWFIIYAMIHVFLAGKGVHLTTVKSFTHFFHPR